MKEYDVHGVYPICNVAGVQIHIEEGYDPIVRWRLAVVDADPKKWHKSKISSTAGGRSYFRMQSKRVYLDEVMRV